MNGWILKPTGGWTTNFIKWNKNYNDIELWTDLIFFLCFRFDDKTKRTATPSHFPIFSWSQRIALKLFSSIFAAEYSSSDSLLSAIAMQRKGRKWSKKGNQEVEETTKVRVMHLSQWETQFVKSNPDLLKWNLFVPKVK